MTSRVTLYYAPHTRAFGVLALMEELDVPYNLEVLNLKAWRNAQREVPGREPDGQGARDRSQRRAGDRAAGGLPVLWPISIRRKASRPPSAIRFAGRTCAGSVYYGSSFEPAVVDRSQKNPPAPTGTVPLRRFRHDAEHAERSASQGPVAARGQVHRAPTCYGASP